jgi:ankyrin repeat protein
MFLFRDTIYKGKNKTMKDSVIYDPNILLREAINDDNIAQLEEAVSLGADFREGARTVSDDGSKSGSKYNILSYAARKGSINIIRYLINEKGWDVNRPDDPGKFTPLHYAARYKNLTLAKCLVEEFKAKTDLRDINSHIPLMSAVLEGGLDMLKYLIVRDPSSVHTRDSEGNSILHWSILVRNHDMTKYLIDKKLLDVNLQDLRGRSVLQDSILTGYLPIVTYLIEEGKANTRILDKEKNTLLHSACCTRNLELVKYILDKQPNVNARNQHGLTPLHIAATNGNLNIVKYLIEEAQANISLTDLRGNNVLLSTFDIDVLYYLVSEQGLDPNTRNIKGKTLLFEAISNKAVNLVAALLKCGANPDRHTYKGHGESGYSYNKYRHSEKIGQLFKAQDFTDKLVDEKYTVRFGKKLHEKYNENQKAEYIRKITPKFNDQQKDVIIGRINHKIKAYSKTQINELNNFLKEESSKGYLTFDLYEDIVKGCPKILKIHIDELMIVYLIGLHNKSFVSLLPKDIQNEIAKIVSPIGYLYMNEHKMKRQEEDTISDYYIKPGKEEEVEAIGLNQEISSNDQV